MTGIQDAPATNAGKSPLLTVENLRTHINTDGKTVRAVDGVSFSIDRGETVCLVGESGSGKTVTCESLTRLLAQPPAEFVDGTVTFDGIDLLEADDATLRSIRGNRIAHVFQNPQRALDPVYTVGDQIAEAITIHGNRTDGAASERAVDLLREVGIPRASTRIDDYPHEFSGGMRQRVAIAIALAAQPDLLIADEPTTAVDVTVQARLLDLLDGLVADRMAMLLVTHDLRVVATLADRVLVMYGGTIVERGPTESVFDQPSHPYTQALFESFQGQPRAFASVTRDAIPTDGCRFRTECPYAIDACATTDQPPFHDVGNADDDTHSPGSSDEHTASCVYYNGERDPDQIITDARSLGGGADE